MSKLGQKCQYFVWPPSFSSTTLTFLGMPSWAWSFICHIHNYTEYNEEWNVFSALNPSKWSSGQPTLRCPGSNWGFGALLKGLTSVVDTSCRSRDSNPQPWVTSGFKSNALSIRPRLPQSLAEDTATTMLGCRQDTLVFVILTWLPPHTLATI